MISLIKLSLHRSGIWRLAWTDSSGLRASDSTDRVELRWLRPSEFRPGWTQGPALIVPNAGTKRPFTHGLIEEGDRIAWYPAPRAGNKHHFTILFADPTAPDESWHKVLRPGGQSVGVLDQRNGTKVVLAQREVPMVEKESSCIYEFAGDMRITYPNSIPEEVDGSVFTAGTDDDGHPYLLDIPMGWENVYLAAPLEDPSGRGGT